MTEKLTYFNDSSYTLSHVILLISLRKSHLFKHKSCRRRCRKWRIITSDNPHPTPSLLRLKRENSTSKLNV